MLEKSCATCLRGPEPTRRMACIDCGDDLVNYVQSRSLADAEAEARIDVIGQNGNDGLHYSEPALADKPALDSNVEAVRQRLAGRAAIGLLKYGCDTTRTDLTRLEWLRHAQHEALDLAVYLERLIADESRFDTPMGRIYGSCADV